MCLVEDIVEACSNIGLITALYVESNGLDLVQAGCCVGIIVCVLLLPMLLCVAVIIMSFA